MADCALLFWHRSAKCLSTFPNSYYVARVGDFIRETAEAVLGALATKSAFAVDPSQRDAWVGEIAILKSNGVNGDALPSGW